MTPKQYEKQLATDISQFYANPLGYVRYAFPWNEKGGPLEGFDGPDEWQIDFLNQLGEQIKDRGFDGVHAVDPIQFAVSSGHGIGKAGSFSTILDTPDGVRRWGDIQPGDRLFGASGKPTTVIARHDQGERDIYRVGFSDGSAAMVDKEHLWTVKGCQQRRNNKDWISLTTEEILEKGVLRKNGKAMAKQWEIPPYEAVQYPPENLSIQPYVLGLWLGDGSKRCGHISSGDPEIFDEIQAFGHELGDPLSGIEGNYSVRNVKGIVKHLRALDLLNRKSTDLFIPDIYKYASVEQRTYLLQGLIDSDGNIDKSGTLCYGSISSRLRDDIIWLVRSLGMIARDNGFKDPHYTDKEGNRHPGKRYYKMSFTWDGKTEVTRLDRYKAALKDPQQRYKTRWIESIEFSHREEAMCVTVDAADHLYLANDFIVTHNSCISAWLILFIMSTRPMSRGVVTANTVPQLEDKTWPELAKWKKMAINGHWFDMTNSRGNLKIWQVGNPENWKVTALANRKENSEGFAGLHCATSTPWYLFDEASAIDDVIAQTAFGGLTDGEPHFYCFGNPTRNTGFFREIFGKFKHRWTTFQIDSRQAKMTNKELIAKWIEDYGEDSDFVRVRIRGIFPNASDRQFIKSDLVNNAKKRDLLPDAYRWQPVVVSVDVARFGSDQTVICIRQGLKVHEFKKYRGLDTQQVGARTIEACREYQEGQTPIIFVDDVGVGGGVTDYLRSMGYIVQAVNGGTVPTERGLYFNKRAECWGRMRTWLRDGGDIPDDKELCDQLTAVEYDYTSKQQIKLERKADMKARGLESPDVADSLAQSFAEFISPDFVEDSFEPEDEYDFTD